MSKDTFNLNPLRHREDIFHTSIGLMNYFKSPLLRQAAARAGGEAPPLDGAVPKNDPRVDQRKIWVQYRRSTVGGSESKSVLKYRSKKLLFDPK